MHQQILPFKNAMDKAQFGPDLSLEMVLDVARFSLRIAPEHIEFASKALKLDLPHIIGGVIQTSNRTALCIGPDEWYIMAPITQLKEIEAAFAALYTTTIHSLVDISHREVSILVKGKKAAYALQAVIAFDLSTMALPSGCRNIMDKTQIILIREEEDLYRIEVWNSFVAHIWHLLSTIGQEIALDI